MTVLFLTLALLTAPLAAGGLLREPIRPSDESARANANHIFNAIHSAGRQWGSSLKHNGFGFIPVVVPAGTLMYHGDTDHQTPVGPEWLAFEVEHAEAFASSWLIRPGQPGSHPQHDHGVQKPLTQEDDGVFRGYFHTYQATRDLQLLYVDGMSAGKTNMGTLDSQDLVLRDNITHEGLPGDFLGELDRANSICDLITQWGFDGLMRTEIGFELIYCNFSSGVQLDSALRTFLEEDKITHPGHEFFMWFRTAAERYDGLLGDRIRMDFSSMVSGFFFPINISSTDPQRPELIRLGAAKLDELRDIKTYLRDVAVEPRKFTVNWQAVVDMIVARYSSRLAALLSGISSSRFVGEVEAATLTYYDARPRPDDVTFAADNRNRTADAVDRCAKHYLKPVLLRQNHWSPQDALIHAALTAVMQDICHNLFLIRSIILEASSGSSAGNYRIHSAANNEALEEAVNKSRGVVRDLASRLSWTTWKKPRLCPEEETLFVAMWPFGDEEDFWNPGCRPLEDLNQGRNSYWIKYGWEMPPSY
ncbi:hypothetical protein PT974_10756 [Cladobotryum mycophilum]|uniref:Uncharacterized protein n=1 Tax=Cladobotryum mycophilum TaxID=491253 RepID=A0ABR0SBR9_9HYPO